MRRKLTFFIAAVLIIAAAFAIPWTSVATKILVMSQPADYLTTTNSQTAYFANGYFSGNVTGTNGVFSGIVSGTTSTFSGAATALSFTATDGTQSSSMTGSSITAVRDDGNRVSSSASNTIDPLNYSGGDNKTGFTNYFWWDEGGVLKFVFNRRGVYQRFIFPGSEHSQTWPAKDITVAGTDDLTAGTADWSTSGTISGNTPAYALTVTTTLTAAKQRTSLWYASVGTTLQATTGVHGNFVGLYNIAATTPAFKPAAGDRISYGQTTYTAGSALRNTSAAIGDKITAHNFGGTTWYVWGDKGTWVAE